jgi:hypothetical protein
MDVTNEDKYIRHKIYSMPERRRDTTRMPNKGWIDPTPTYALV